MLELGQRTEDRAHLSPVFFVQKLTNRTARQNKNGKKEAEHDIFFSERF
jgi:hypothetical protein